MQLSARNSLAIVETKIELNSHTAKCVVGDQCLVMHDHSRPVNVYGYDPKAESKHVCIINTIVACQGKLLSSQSTRLLR